MRHTCQWVLNRGQHRRDIKCARTEKTMIPAIAYQGVRYCVLRLCCLDKCVKAPEVNAETNTKIASRSCCLALNIIYTTPPVPKSYFSLIALKYSRNLIIHHGQFAYRNYWPHTAGIQRRQTSLHPPTLGQYKSELAGCCGKSPLDIFANQAPRDWMLSGSFQ